MNKTLTLAAFVMFAVIMGMSAIAPALAVKPPSDPRADPHPPELTCVELEAELDAAGVPSPAKEIILARAGC